MSRFANTKRFIDYYRKMLPGMQQLVWPDDLLKAGFEPQYAEGNQVIEHYCMSLNKKKAVQQMP